MKVDPDIGVLETARTPLAAELIVAILRAEGIPAYVDGSLLQDEFAVSQRVMGLGGVKIQVPRERLEEARKALEAAREAGTKLGPGSEETGEGGEDR